MLLPINMHNHIPTDRSVILKQVTSGNVYSNTEYLYSIIT